MLIENWVEFIKGVVSDSAFKEIGVAALRLLYGRPIRLSDGTGDGGVDAWMDVSPTKRVPVQFHSGRSIPWHRKLDEDLEKPLVKQSTLLYFVTGQTPEEIEVMRKKAELRDRLGIEVEVLTARHVASFANQPSVLDLLSKISGVHASSGERPGPTRELDARLSFWFFHEKSGEFREEVARSLLAASLVRADDPIAVERLIDDALALMGGESRHRGLIRRQLEKYIEDGTVVRDGGGVRASAAFIHQTKAILNILQGAADKLREDCARALEKKVHSHKLRQETVDSVFDDLGFLLRRSIIDKLPGTSNPMAAVRLNAIERRLSDALKPTGGSANEALQTLMEVASSSVYGRNLASAELFIQLTERDAVDVARILTGRERMEVLLDASVAMPIFCALHDHVATGWVTSVLAHELYELLRTREIRMSVPHLYLEEMAAHLIAAKQYRPLIGCDDDLSRSINFFVAHYHSVKKSRNESVTIEGFDEFLRGFGLPPDIDSLDFVVARRKVERAMAEQLHFYGMPAVRVSFTSATSLPDEPSREKRVLEHDRCVAHWLDTRSLDNFTDGFVLCTQDRWLLSAVAGRDWLAVDAATLVDLVQLTRPRGNPAPLACVRELACRFTDAVTVRAAAIWDFLVKLEGSNLANRELLEHAKQFKEAWLLRRRETDVPKPEDWQRFKDGMALE
jgi:hypothetical protein